MIYAIEHRPEMLQGKKVPAKDASKFPSKKKGANQKGYGAGEAG